MTKSLYYFDDSNGWTERKPSNLPVFALKTITLCNVDLNRVDSSDIDKFNELLTIHSPSIVIAHAVSPQSLTRIKAFNSIRKSYALLETNFVAMHEEGTIVLLRLGLQSEPTELTSKSEGKQLLRALLQIPARFPGGLTLNITIMNMENRVPLQRRLQIEAALLKPTVNANESAVFVLISNVAEGFDYNEDLQREIQTLRNSSGFVDMFEEASEKNILTPWTMYMKSNKFAPVSPSLDMIRGQEPRFLACTIAQRSANALQTIAIPMPRSAKTGCMKSPTLSSTTPSSNQALTDPAILSAEAAKCTVPAGTQNTDIFSRLLQQQQQQHLQQTNHQKWKASNSFVLKGNDTKLSNVEGVFDVTNLFNSVNEALDALNSKALNWPADYCIVHNTVLCSDSVKHCDRQGFRRYAREAKGNTSLTSQIYAATSAFVNGSGYNNHTQENKTSGSAWIKPTRAELDDFTFQRQLKRDEMLRREWHESCCTIVYQLTSSEMNKFNITPQIGLGKDNLKKAVHYLNRAKLNMKDNPLQDYAYDYALLFSVERQGYWLLAATHVPCDIVACRMVA